MLVTREADYAIRLLRGLADGKIHPVKKLCETEQIPWKFAYKILKKLKDAELVESISGARGGCRLIADLDYVTLLDVITAIEDNLYLNECLRPGHECAWVSAKEKPCSVCLELGNIQRKLSSELEQHTLSDLIYEVDGSASQNKSNREKHQLGEKVS
jgi:Rrf2 family protein